MQIGVFLPELSGGGPTLAPAPKAETHGLLSEAPSNTERGDRVWKELSFHDLGRGVRLLPEEEVHNEQYLCP